MDVVARRRPGEGRVSRVDLLRNQLAVAVPERSAAHVQAACARSPTRRSSASRSAIRPRCRPASTRSSTWRRKDCGTRSQPRVVPTGSVRAALAAVESGAADAAIVYRTDARVALQATVAWVVPADRGPRIVYPAAIVRGRTTPSGRAAALPRLPARSTRPRASSSELRLRDGHAAAALALNRRWTSGGSPGSPSLCAAGATLLMLPPGVVARVAAGAPPVSRPRAGRDARLAAAGHAAGRDRPDPADAARPPRPDRRAARAPRHRHRLHLEGGRPGDGDHGAAAARAHRARRLRAGERALRARRGHARRAAARASS